MAGTIAIITRRLVDDTIELLQSALAVALGVGALALFTVPYWGTLLNRLDSLEERLMKPKLWMLAWRIRRLLARVAREMLADHSGDLARYAAALAVGDRAAREEDARIIAADLLESIRAVAAGRKQRQVGDRLARQNRSG